MNQKGSDTQGLTTTNQTNSSLEDSNLESIYAEENGYLESPIENEEVILEPLEHNPYEVSYTCLLLPRSKSHSLSDELTDYLKTNLEHIAVSFGWSLDFLSIKPEYLQWVIRVPPSTSTTYVIQVVRKQLSQKIFMKFPQYKNDDQSDDFWAPGYLIFWGSQPHPPEIIQRYIDQTRRQQGA